jgi:hypothetical protein
MADLDKIEVAADVHTEEKPLVNENNKKCEVKGLDGNDAKGESETEAGSEAKGDDTSGKNTVFTVKMKIMALKIRHTERSQQKRPNLGI